jgi:hypothetical protein
MVVSRLTSTSLKKRDLLESLGLFENRHKIIMIRVDTKDGSLLKKRRIFKSTGHVSRIGYSLTEIRTGLSIMQDLIRLPIGGDTRMGFPEP